MSVQLTAMFRAKLEELFREVAARDMEISLVEVLEHMLRWTREGIIPAGARCDPGAMFALIQETWEENYHDRHTQAAA